MLHSTVLAFLTTAELSILATVVVAIAGFYFNARNADRDRQDRASQAALEREHAESLAYSERIFRVRSETDAEADRALYREAIAVWRACVAEEGGEHKPRVDPVSDEDWARIIGQISVHSSDLVLEGIEQVRQAMASVTDARTAYQDTRDRAERDPSLEAELEAELLDLFVETARDRADNAIDEAEKLRAARGWVAGWPTEQSGKPRGGPVGDALTRSSTWHPRAQARGHDSSPDCNESETGPGTRDRHRDDRDPTVRRGESARRTSGR